MKPAQQPSEREIILTVQENTGKKQSAKVTENMYCEGSYFHVFQGTEQVEE